MNENDYRIIEPRNIPTSNHGVHDWALRFCVISSIAFSFGNSTNAETTLDNDSPRGIYVPVCDGGSISIPKTLVTELNINAEIKERLISRLIEFKNELQQGWNGHDELPMEELSVSNALSAVEATASEEFSKWTVFPSPNGTILFSPTDDFIAGISIGNEEFSYAALGNQGQEIKGKEVFSVKSFKLAIRLINSLNEA